MVDRCRSIEFKFRNIPSLPDLDLRTSEYVYFVESDTPGKLIKIGKTESLRQRLMLLQGTCPVQLTLIGVIRAPCGTESLFHALLALSRAHGEWFYPSTEVMELAGQLPKLGTLDHTEIRDLCVSRGCSHLQVTAAFNRRSKRKKRPRMRFGQLVFK